MRLRILQTESLDFMFKPYDRVAENGVDLDKYDVVWEEELPEGVELEDIFTRFNVEIPRGYKGRSLSVSDIVEADGVMWYVDRIGFKRL